MPGNNCEKARCPTEDVATGTPATTIWTGGEGKLMALIAGGFAYILVAGLICAPWWLIALALPVLVLGAILEARSLPPDPRTDADWSCNEANTW
jgi:hypothetical protein